MPSLGSVLAEVRRSDSGALHLLSSTATSLCRLDTGEVPEGSNNPILLVPGSTGPVRGEIETAIWRGRTAVRSWLVRLRSQLLDPSRSESDSAT